MNTPNCEFCGEFGHMIRECNDQQLHDDWLSLVNMISDYTVFNEETFAIQRTYLQCSLAPSVALGIAMRFCNFTYVCLCSFDDICDAIYHELKNQYSDMANEAEISDMLNESIVIIDPDAEVENQFQLTIEPMLFCLETTEELHEEVYCSICLDNHTRMEAVTTNCGHVFGKGCMCDHLDYQLASYGHPTCPMCRTDLRTLEIKDVDFYDELYERYVTALLAIAPSNMPEDLDSVVDVAFLDSFEFMPQSVF
jgi:hypothetical protein